MIASPAEVGELPSLLLILNPRAGSASAAGRLEEILRAGGQTVRTLRPEGQPALLAAASEAKSGPEEVVVATGGDGTISLIASHICGTRKSLGVIPGGTLNHFAKDLGIPPDLNEAARTVLNGKTILVDVGELNGRVFINNSSLGLYPAFVKFREKSQEVTRSKWLATIPALTRALAGGLSFRAWITADDKRFARRTLMLFVGNNEYCVDGLEIGTRDSLTGGKLCLLVTRTQSRILLFRGLLMSAMGIQSGDLDQITAEHIQIESRHKQISVAIDGEVVSMQPPLEYRIRPKALRVIVPQELSR